MKKLLNQRVFLFPVLLFFAFSFLVSVAPHAQAAVSCTAPQVACGGVCTTPFCTTNAQCAQSYGTGSVCGVAAGGCANYCTLTANGGTGVPPVVLPSSGAGSSTSNGGTGVPSVVLPSSGVGSSACAAPNVTTDISSQATVGQSWTITLTGPVGANVSANTSLPVPSTTGLGMLDSSCTKTLTGTFAASSLTNNQSTPWAETYSVGNSTFPVNFTLNPASAGGVVPVIITQSSFPGAIIGSAYNTNLQGTVAAGRTATWTLNSNAGSALPPGLSMSPSGVISGTPTKTGTWALSVNLSDGTQSVTSNSLYLTVASANPNIGTSVPYLDAIIKQTGDLTSFLNSAAFEGVYWQGTAPGTADGGVSGDYATQDTANELASAFGGTVVSELAPPTADPYGYYVSPTGTENPPQWFVQFPDGTLMNAGTLAQDYFMGASTAQVNLAKAITDTAKSYTASPDGSPITWQPDPSTDYSQLVGTDSQGYTWATGGSSCGLVAWTGFGMALHANPAPYATQTTSNNMTCTPGTSNITGADQTPSFGVSGTSSGSSSGSNQSGSTQQTTGTSNLTNTSASSVSSTLNAIESSLLQYHIANPATQTQSSSNSSNQTTSSGSGSTAGTVSSEGLLTVLQQSLASIQSSLNSSSNLSSDTVTSITAVVNSISQIIQTLLGTVTTTSSTSTTSASSTTTSTTTNTTTTSGTGSSSSVAGTRAGSANPLMVALARPTAPVHLPKRPTDSGSSAALGIAVSGTTSTVYAAGSSWTLVLNSSLPNQSFTICAIANGVQSCTPNWGTTDASGTWISAGVFPTSTIGVWTEWVKFPSLGLTSNQISFTVAPAGSSATAGSDVGIYIWSGNYTGAPAGHLLSTSVSLAAQNGFHVARVTLSPTYNTDYNVSSGCYPNFTLQGLASSPEYQTTFATPGIDTFILTAYDGVSFGDCTTKKYMQLSFMTPDNLTAIQNEYRDLTTYLYRTYQGTGKTFILSNWESDNDAYCGASYSYVVSSTVQAACNKSYSTMYGGNSSVHDTMSALTQWFSARQAGIDAGRAAAAADNWTDVAVYGAAEFNSVNALHSVGFPSVLYDVLPNVQTDYISYSSYESINNNPSTLAADIQTIHQVAGPTQLIIGEFGFDRSVYGDTVVASKMQDVVSTIQNTGTPYGVAWQMFDQSNGDFGVFSVTPSSGSGATSGGGGGGGSEDVQPRPQEQVLVN